VVKIAQKRMFDKSITNSDDFIDMPDSSQNLYFHLSMNADDDGFVNNWKNIMRMTGHKEDDLKVLISKQFVIPFESGVIVIRHWRINNCLRKDRRIETKHKAEMQQLQLDESLVYQLTTNCQPNDNQLTTKWQPSIEENSIDKDSIEESMRGDGTQAQEPSTNNYSCVVDSSAKASKETKHRYGEYHNVLLKDKELQKLQELYPNWEELITYLDEYIEMKGYKAKSHYLCIRKWVVDAVSRDSQNKQQVYTKDYNPWNIASLKTGEKENES